MPAKILKYKHIWSSLFLGGITSWLMKEEITPRLLGGKNFDGRSWPVQVRIISVYLFFTSLFFFVSSIFYSPWY